MCTSLIISDVNGNAHHCRTLKFSVCVPANVSPKGSKIESVTPDAKQTVTFNTKYSILGMTSDAIPNSKQATIVEAANAAIGRIGPITTINAADSELSADITAVQPNEIVEKVKVKGIWLGGKKIDTKKFLEQITAIYPSQQQDMVDAALKNTHRH
jgi:hypothetical protein